MFGARSDLRSLVDFTLTHVVPDQFNSVTCLRYHDLPDQEFDLIFVDGPPTIFGDVQFPSTDAFHAIRRSSRPADIIVDHRMQTLSRYSTCGLRKRMESLLSMAQPISSNGRTSSAAKAEISSDAGV
jgi:hypothetical protein